MSEPTCGDCIYCLRSYPPYCGKYRFTEGPEDLAICPDFKRKNTPKIHICECGMSLGVGNILDARTIIYKGDYMCTKCYERKTMPNIKITAEVDGKQVPLETVSTETFEAIKALEKPKEIPVARVGNYRGKPDNRRLFLRVSDHLRNVITKQTDIRLVAIELRSGYVSNCWEDTQHKLDEACYENVRPL